MSLSSGWALGSDEFKEALIRDHNLAADTRAWEFAGAQTVSEQRWAEALKEACDSKPQKNAAVAPQIHPWKVAIAAYLKATTDVPNPWLAAHFVMGSPFYVSKHAGRLRQGLNAEAQLLLRRLEAKGKA